MFYGSALKAGYSSGVVTFSLSSVIPNLRQMPSPLVKSMPMTLLALAALGWMAVRAVRSRRWGSEAAQRQSSQRLAYRRDAVIGTFLALGWIGMWGLYFAYDWTVKMAGGAGGGVHVIRFYLPALGLITLLAAWLLVHLPRWLTVVVLVALIGLGAWSYADLAYWRHRWPWRHPCARHRRPWWRAGLSRQWRLATARWRRPWRRSTQWRTSSPVTLEAARVTRRSAQATRDRQRESD